MHTAALIAFALCAAPAGEQAPLRAQELAPGVFALSTSHKYASANIGWVEFSDHVVLVGAPHPDVVARALAQIEMLNKKPVRGVIVTHVREGEKAAVRILAAKGVVVHAQRDAARQLRAEKGAESWLVEFSDRKELRDGARNVELIALGHAAGPGDSAVYVHGAQVLFTGEAGVNGPRAELPGSRTWAWIEALEKLRALPIRTVVPGFGTIGGPVILDRFSRFLREMRRQVGYRVAQGRPFEAIYADVRIEPEWLVWMPYDTPTKPDVQHVYNELTIPQAPFADRPFDPSDRRPKALALIGDRPHEPGHFEEGLGKALELAGVDFRFAVDFRALNAENLKQVQLLVILRDGAIWPNGVNDPPTMWITPAQEQAVVEFVERGGAFLPLHNSTGIYPDGGPYLKLLGGTYTGHGPLERFRVRVVDHEHPITQGVEDFEVADEQHTPIPDRSKVHLLLESRSEDGVVAAGGWAYEAGKGRVCYLANGHTRDALNHPMYRRLIKNAIQWCLKRSE